MTTKNWSEIGHLQLGRIGEYYAKAEFIMHGFEVYTTEVDDRGVDFVAKSKGGKFYQVQAKAVRNNNYMYIRKSKLELAESNLVCYMRFVDGEEPEVYVIPSTVWKNPDQELFKAPDYEGKKSQPEYALYVSKKGNLEKLQKYRAEDMLRELNSRDK